MGEAKGFNILIKSPLLVLSASLGRTIENQPLLCCLCEWDEKIVPRLIEEFR